MLAAVFPLRKDLSPEPEYSEEARKAKFQGTCVLWLIVGPDGKAARHPRATHSRIGLDEKAIEAVKNLALRARHERWQAGRGGDQRRSHFRLY
jgi:outer membrane biosynthesis protein TonB